MAEAVFMIYALGFTLEKVAAMQEHGIEGSGILHPALFTQSDNQTLQYISRARGYVPLAPVRKRRI